MATGAAIATVAATGISMYSSRKRAKAQEQAALDQAAAKRQQAQEILERSKINIERTKGEAQDVKARQTAAFVAGGVDVTSGATLQQSEALQEALLENIMDQEREAHFVALQLRKGADVDTRLSGDIAKANRLSLIGQGLSGATSAFANFRRAGGQ